MNSTLDSEELANQVNIIDCMSQIVQNEMSMVDGAGDLTFTKAVQEYAAVVVRVPKSSMPSDTANSPHSTQFSRFSEIFGLHPHLYRTLIVVLALVLALLVLMCSYKKLLAEHKISKTRFSNLQSCYSRLQFVNVNDHQKLLRSSETVEDLTEKNSILSKDVERFQSKSLAIFRQLMNAEEEKDTLLNVIGYKHNEIFSDGTVGEIRNQSLT